MKYQQNANNQQYRLKKKEVIENAFFDHFPVG